MVLSLPYHNLVPEELRQRLSHSRPPQLDCGNCEAGYDLSIKCCAYFPKIPNFALAYVFQEQGFELFTDWIQQKKFIYPIGLIPPASYVRNYVDNREGGVSMLCPLFEAGDCSVWRYRELECSLFFCRPWEPEGIREELSRVEEVVCQMGLVELGYSDKDIRRLIAVRENPGLEISWEELWGPYAGREAAFFSKIYRFSRSLSPQVVTSWLALES